MLVTIHCGGFGARNTRRRTCAGLGRWRLERARRLVVGSSPASSPACVDDDPAVCKGRRSTVRPQHGLAAQDLRVEAASLRSTSSDTMNCVISIPRSVREIGIGSLVRFLASVAIVAATRVGGVAFLARFAGAPTELVTVLVVLAAGFGACDARRAFSSASEGLRQGEWRVVRRSEALKRGRSINNSGPSDGGQSSNVNTQPEKSGLTSPSRPETS
jgi:hypothetical protein